jgi:hypothetical protein
MSKACKESARFSHLAVVFVFTLGVTLPFLISINQPISYAKSPTQICINGVSKMKSGYAGYHSQITRINDECMQSRYAKF